MPRQYRSKKSRQIGFRVTPAVKERIEAASIAKNLSVQDLITTAVHFYLNGPAPQAIHDSEDTKEEQDWSKLWQRYMTDMPRTKTLLIVEMMKLDLQHYRSSRLKRK